MKLHVLFGQRKEHYPGEYMPEALATDDFESLVVVVVVMEVNGAKILEILRPVKPVLQAQIVDQVPA